MSCLKGVQRLYWFAYCKWDAFNDFLILNYIQAYFIILFDVTENYPWTTKIENFEDKKYRKSFIIIFVTIRNKTMLQIPNDNFYYYFSYFSRYILKIMKEEL